MKDIVFVYKTGEDVKVNDLIQIAGYDGETSSNEKALIGKIGIVLGTGLEEYDERKVHCLRLYMFNPPQRVFCFNAFRLEKISL